MVLAFTMLWTVQASRPAYAVPRLEGVTVKGLPAVTGRIAVDQFGYRSEGTKVAIVTDPLKGFDAGESYTPGPRLEVRSRGGKVVLSGAPRVWQEGATHEDSGDRGWWFDFSALRKPGEYYVYDPSTRLRSPVFRIGDGVFAPVLKAAVRTFYFQRIGVPIEAKFAKGPWTDGAAYLQDTKARSVDAKEDASKVRDLSGGWMDAGDTNKYPAFLGDVIHPLLYAYRANPKAFGDDYDIPESGNGRPDLLDEIKVELDWLTRMQDPQGGVPIKMGVIDYDGKLPLSLDLRTRYYGPNDSGAAIYTAAVFAHAARVYDGFPAWKAYAKGLRERAERSWNWYKGHPRTFKLDTGEIKAGLANRSAEEQDRMEAYAAIHLFALTGDAKYNRAVVQRVGTTAPLAEGSWPPYGAGASEVLVDYLSMPGANVGVCARIREALARVAKDERFAPEGDLFRAWMNPNNYHWGSNFVRAAWGVVALLATTEADPATALRLRTRAADMVHSFHGVNPLSAVYLSNMGAYGAERSMMRIYHARYGEGTPFMSNPPPGYVVGGPNAQFSGKAADGSPSIEWVKSQPRAKAYMDSGRDYPEATYELSEPAIYYQALYIRLLAPFGR